MGNEGDLLAELRVLLEERVECGEAPQHVLREVSPIDAQDQAVAPAAKDLLLVLLDLLGLCRAVESPGVDPERIRPHPRLTVRMHDGASLVVDLELHELAAAVQEVAAVGGGVEADDVVGEQAAE